MKIGKFVNILGAYFVIFGFSKLLAYLLGIVPSLVSLSNSLFLFILKYLDIFEIVNLEAKLLFLLPIPGIQAITPQSLLIQRGLSILVTSFLIVLGFFIIRHKEWARKVALIFLILNITNILYGVMPLALSSFYGTTIYKPSTQSIILNIFLPFTINIVFVYLLLHRMVKKQFS